MVNMISYDPLEQLAEYEEIEADLLRGRGPVQVGGLTDGAKAYVTAVTAATRPWRLLVTYDEVRARELLDDIGCFTDNVLYYPARDLLFYSADIRGNLISGQRIDVWRHMAQDAGGCVVTTIDALMDRLEAPEQFRKKTLHIDEHDAIDIDSLSSALSGFGYERTSQVEDKGQYAVRGGIVDIFPLTEDVPFRIDLWGDAIDSMKTFDVQTQRSIEQVHELTIYPAAEPVLGGSTSFLRYFDIDRTVIFVDEPARVRERARAVEQEFTEGMTGRIESGQLDAADAPELFSAQEVLEDLASPHTMYMSGLDGAADGDTVRRAFSMTVKNVASYRNAFEMLIEDLRRYNSLGYTVIVLSASETRTHRLAESLREYGIPAYVPDQTADGIYDIHPASTAVIYGNLHKGFEMPLIKFAIISESDIFGVRKKKKRRKYHSDDASAITSLSELTVGDYVIHEDHGLGIYRGIEKIERDHTVKDYIKLEYAGGDNCYLPATRLEVIQKYSSGGEEAKKPKLNKLGGTEWGKTRSSVKKAVAEIAKELVALYAERLNGRGYQYGPDTVWQREFEELFEYQETDDQLKAIADVKRDMESGKIMDRLICGDVGYGKTEVALRAAFKVVQEGRQVIYLVPTTILAQQHYNTFTQRMKGYPVRIDMLSRFRSSSQQAKTVEDFKKGLVDIIIGTHRVLSQDIEPKALGLLIIDEEQRFGVKHKEKLKQLRRDVDVMSLTATPIPRTLHMSLVGIRDMSLLEEAPQDRQPVQTYVMEYSDEIAREAIRRELARGGQVYYLYNRVNGIADIAAKVQSLVPDASVGYAHGQMGERELESVMLDFINGDIDVLVTTTIIETGLDIPNANTIIMHDSDRLGLAQLYQLRGRVGRSGRTAYAFLFYRRGRMLGEEAEKRLKSIKEFTELGSGVKIAMRDLEIRGAGNVLGAEQHGHMLAVGYDLYCKMLGTAVRELKGEDITRTQYETSVDADIDAYIPSDYIRSEESKLDIYKRIASIQSGEDLMDMQDELLDRFGEIPKAVDNLLQIAIIKAMAHECYVTDVEITKQTVTLTMYPQARLDVERIPELVSSYRGMLRIRQGKETAFIYEERGRQINCAATMAAAKTLLERLHEYI